jgi:hypothetical protein
MYVQPRDAEKRRATWDSLGQIPELRVLWLERNPVRRVISFAIARKTGKWIGKKTKAPVQLDADYIPNRLTFEEKWANEAHERLQKCKIMDVRFESLTAHPDTVLNEIQDFLDLPNRPLHSLLTRQNPRSLQEMVANFDEVKDALLDTKWEEALFEAMDHQPRDL